MVHVNRNPELTTVFLPFPVLTSAHLTGTLPSDVVPFLRVLPTDVFPPNPCEPSALFPNALFCQVVF